MKRIKLGALAIVALFAMSFTVASKSGIFSQKLANAAVEPGCYETVTLAFPNQLIDATHARPLTNGTSDACLDNADGAFIEISSTQYFIPRTVVDADQEVLECPVPFDVFCCYNVNSNSEVFEICYKEPE